MLEFSHLAGVREARVVPLGVLFSCLFAFRCGVDLCVLFSRKLLVIRGARDQSGQFLPARTLLRRRTRFLRHGSSWPYSFSLISLRPSFSCGPLSPFASALPEPASFLLLPPIQARQAVSLWPLRLRHPQRRQLPPRSSPRPTLFLFCHISDLTGSRYLRPTASNKIQNWVCARSPRFWRWTLRVAADLPNVPATLVGYLDRLALLLESRASHQCCPVVPNVACSIA